MKLLAKDSLHPYFSVNCPCSQQPLTGKWFLDYFSYYPRNLVELELFTFPEWPYAEAITQTESIHKMQDLNANWKPSAITITQPHFYRSAVIGEHGLDNPRTELLYRTKELEISGNNFLFQQQMFKELNWWNYLENNSDYKLVSGDSTSAISYNYNLSTTCETFTISQNVQSGFISSLIINNVDNDIVYQTFITGNPINQFSLRAPNGSNYRVLTDKLNNDFVPIANKSYANNQYYASRVYRGSQYGYIYSKIKPSQYYYNLGKLLVNNDFFICGDDDPPVSGKTVYFKQVGTEIYYVRKIGDKYYQLYNYDQKTIVEVPSTDIVSGVIQYDQPAIIKVTTGLVVIDENDSSYNLLSSTDGLLLQDVNGDLIPIDQFRTDSYLGEMWSNYQYTVGINTYYTTKIYGQSGQYYLEYSYESETIDDVDYYWWYYVCFPKEYDATTSTATLNVYKFGEDTTNNIPATAFVASTSIITSRIWDWEDYQNGYMDDPQPQVTWDNQLSCFYYLSGNTADTHPTYCDMYVDVYHFASHNIGGSYYDTERFYLYSAPAWVGLQIISYDHLSIDQQYVISGSSYNTLEVFKYNDLDEQQYQTDVYQGWWTYYEDISTNNIYRVLSAADGWYIEGLSSMVKGTAAQLNYLSYDSIIESGYIENNIITAIIDYYPLTGGTLFDPQNSIAVGEPDRPPYWYFPYEMFYGVITSGRYFYDQYNKIVPIVTAYYDTYYGHLINTWSIDDYVTDHWNGYDQEYNPNPAYFRIKDMINNYAYSYCNPFIKYVETEYHYVNDALGENYTDNPTIAQFFQLYKDPDYPFSGDIVATEYLFDKNWSESWRMASQWGGNGPSNDLEYRTRTQKFVKMTAEEINDTYIVPVSGISYVDKDLSAALALQQGIYCQILTGFWLRNDYDKRDYYEKNNVRGIRKSGVFYATLNFNTEYKFGFDLSNASQLNDLLSSDGSICYKADTNGNIVGTTVSSYWANMSAGIQSSVQVKSANFSKFFSYCYIRPISGVFGI